MLSEKIELEALLLQKLSGKRVDIITAANGKILSRKTTPESGLSPMKVICNPRPDGSRRVITDFGSKDFIYNNPLIIEVGEEPNADIFLKAFEQPIEPGQIPHLPVF